MNIKNVKTQHKFCVIKQPHLLFYIIVNFKTQQHIFCFLFTLMTLITKQILAMSRECLREKKARLLITLQIKHTYEN